MSDPELNQVDDCDFCRIARGESPDAEVIAEGSEWLAFFPLNPATPGHTLVIPKTHVANVWDVNDALGSALMSAVIKVGRGIEKGLDPQGMNMISSAGSAAEQTVFHLHIHVVPRWPGDGFGRIWPTDHRHENADLDNVADRIRAAL